MRKEDIKRLEAFEMWTWRRMEKVSWTEHKQNEEEFYNKRSLTRSIKPEQGNGSDTVLGENHC